MNHNYNNQIGDMNLAASMTCQSFGHSWLLQNYPSQTLFDIPFIVSNVPDFNLLGRNATYPMGISVDDIFHSVANERDGHEVNAVFDDLEQDRAQQEKCCKLCNEFPIFGKLNWDA